MLKGMEMKFIITKILRRNRAVYSLESLFGSDWYETNRNNR